MRSGAWPVPGKDRGGMVEMNRLLSRTGLLGIVLGFAGLIPCAGGS